MAQRTFKQTDKGAERYEAIRRQNQVKPKPPEQKAPQPEQPNQEESEQ